MFEICSAAREIPSESVSLLDLKYQTWDLAKFEIVLSAAQMRSQNSSLLVTY